MAKIPSSLLNHDLGFISKDQFKTEYLGGKIIFHNTLQMINFYLVNFGSQIVMLGFVTSMSRMMPIEQNLVLLNARI
jgi:hypothetical protein